MIQHLICFCIWNFTSVVLLLASCERRFTKLSSMKESRLLALSILSIENQVIFCPGVSPSGKSACFASGKSQFGVVRIWAWSYQDLKHWNLLQSARLNNCCRETPMRMQSSSESGRVAPCLHIGTTSLKTKCVRLRNERSFQHPKQISSRAIVDGTRRTILVVHLRYCNPVLAIALCKNFPHMFSYLRRSDRRVVTA